MGRPLRLKAPGLTYHVMSRTTGKRLLLQKLQDKKALCKILRRVLNKYGVILYGFTPMNNHFHMLIRIENGADLSQVIAEFKCLYAKYFNNKYHRCGPFWNDRFRSTIIQDDRHVLTCLRYIDRNAVKAGLVDHPSKWLLGSFHAYAYGKIHPLLPLQPHPSYLGLSQSKEERRAYYLSLVVENTVETDALYNELYRLTIFGSENFKRELAANIN